MYGGIAAQSFQTLANDAGRSTVIHVINGDFDAGALARAHEVAYIGHRGLVVADEDDCQPGMNAGLAKRSRARQQVDTKFGGERPPVENLGRHVVAHSSREEANLERVRREVVLGRGFSAGDFTRALASFRELYNVAPAIVLCSPDVLERYCLLFADPRDATRHDDIRHEGLLLVAAVQPLGTIAFEGEVDEDRMGDW